MKFEKLNIKLYGKISLLTILILGIFSLVPAYGAVTETVSLTATNKTAASFSFDISPLNSRKYIYPTKVSFDTTGKVTSISPVPSYSGDFPAWDSGYPVNNWNRLVNNQNSSKYYENYIQISQFPHNFVTESLRDKFLVCGIALGTSKIAYGISDSPSGFINCFSTMNSNVSTNLCSNKAFATIISSNRAYCCWTYKPTDSNPVIILNSYTNSWLGDITINNSQISEDWGVSGCLMKDGNDEYVVIAYPTSANSISLLSFKDGNPNNYTITSGISVTNNISGAQIAISQNPRTGVVYLGWISGSNAFYKMGSFQPNSSTKFSFTNNSSDEIDFCDVNCTTAAFASIYAGSYNNFETSFTVSDDNGIINYCICGNHYITQTIAGTQSISNPKFAAAFQYLENNKYYSGCISCSRFRTFDFYSRLQKRNFI